MRVALIAHRPSPTSLALAGRTWDGTPIEVLSPRDALLRLEGGDIALVRLDVREDVGGIEEGLSAVERLADQGVTLLNPPSALLRAHDKVLTERTLRRLALSEWFRATGAIAQELIPPLGHDLRLIVAGGGVIGASRRTAAPGEWRTNVALGATVSHVSPSPVAVELARAAGEASGLDLVGVDLLPTGPGGFSVLELNGAVDFRPVYAAPGRDIFTDAIAALSGCPRPSVASAASASA